MRTDGRADGMRWIGRLVAAVFGLGVILLVVGLGLTLWRAEGVPAMPILAALFGLVVLILLSGACLALISIAISLRRGVFQPAAAPLRTVRPMHEPSAARADMPAETQPYAPDQTAGSCAPSRPARPARPIVATR
ncbi:MAG: hypothetical protein P3W94_004045 [Paracoccus sp. (in: a-proteobacteria)]|nr:hypothetical protein [Paracoccus sp. (in: a-proteobacteria)]